MSKELVLKAIAETKPAEIRLPAWQNLLGKAFAVEAEMMQQVLSDEPKKIVLPDAGDTDGVRNAISSIKSIEDKIVELKRKEKETTEKRKQITSRFDDVKDRLMLPEKTYKIYYETLSKDLLPLKRMESSIKQQIENHQREQNDFRGSTRVKFNDDVAEAMSYINEKVSIIYKGALEHIAPMYVRGFISQKKAEFTVHNFQRPNNQYGIDWKDSIVKEVYDDWNPFKFVEHAHNLIDSVFADFEVAKQNSEDALEREEKRKQDELSVVLDEKETQNTVAELEVKADIIPSITQQTKQLKKIWVADMAHSEENMRIIITAFYSNYIACMASIRRADPFDIDINAMLAALVKLKNEDSQFESGKLLFKQIDKL